MINQLLKFTLYSDHKIVKGKWGSQKFVGAWNNIVVHRAACKISRPLDNFYLVYILADWLKSKISWLTEGMIYFMSKDYT